MSDYSKTTNFGAKDLLSPGDANKKINGTLFDTEFDAIATAVATKANSASPTFTGTVVMTAPQIQDTSADHQYVFAVNELAADRTVTLPLLTGNDEFVFKDHTATLTAKTIDLTSNTLQGSKTEFNTALESDTFLMASDLLDEDTMTSNSATQPASQQSIKAYVDAQITSPGYVNTTGVVNANEFPRFSDADTLEALTAAELRSAINVEDGADVTDTANVTAAGALMDSEVDADIKTLVLPANTTISTFGASIVDDANAAAVLTTLGITSTVAELNYSDGVTSNIQTQIDSIATGSWVWITPNQTASADAAISFDDQTSGIFDGTYDVYVVQWHDITGSSDGATLQLRTTASVGASKTYDNGASDYIVSTDWSGTSTVTDTHIAAGAIETTAGCSANGMAIIYHPDGTNKTCIICQSISFASTGSTISGGDTFACRDSAAAITGIEFSPSAGTITGNFSIYGIKRS